MIIRTYAGARAVVLLLVAPIALSACGSGGMPEQDTASVRECRPVDVGSLRLAGWADYEPQSPHQLASAVDTVVVGTSVDFVPGYREIEGPDEIPYLLLQVRVSDVLVADDEPAFADDLVYVRVDQGPIHGTTGEPMFAIEDFRAAILSGTRLLLFLNRIDVSDAARAALPEGGVLLGAPMDGMVVESCGRLVGGKDDLGRAWSAYPTLDLLAAALRDG